MWHRSDNFATTKTECQYERQFKIILKMTCTAPLWLHLEKGHFKLVLGREDIRYPTVHQTQIFINIFEFLTGLTESATFLLLGRRPNNWAAETEMASKVYKWVQLATLWWIVKHSNHWASESNKFDRWKH